MSVRDVTDELLSGYLDDEVTAGERASVEDALASSVDVQTRLTRLAEARDAVRLLDDPVLPDNFLVGIERAVTADRPASVGSPTSPTTPAARVRTHRGVSWLAGGVAAAALVAALVIPATNRANPSVRARIDTHVARASVGDDPVSELAPLAVAGGGLHR